MLMQRYHRDPPHEAYDMISPLMSPEISDGEDADMDVSDSEGENMNDDDNIQGNDDDSDDDESDDDESDDDDDDIHHLHRIAFDWSRPREEGVDGLAEHLLQSGFWEKGSRIDRAFRCVDRAKFLPEELQEQAYVDGPMRYGLYHHSGPHIYASVINELDVQPDDSFCNIGSGTGYLSMLVAMLQSSTAVNHGIELHEELVGWAKQKTSQVVLSLDECDRHCSTPQFFRGNAYAIDTRNRKYNKMYIGQECPDMATCEQFLRLLDAPGVLVVPIESCFFRICKDEDGDVSATAVSSVGFGELVPKKDNDQIVLMEQQKPMSLMAICRRKIRLDIGPNRMNTVLRKLSLPRNITRYLNYQSPVVSESSIHQQRFVLDFSCESVYCGTRPIVLEHSGSVMIQLNGADSSCKYGRDMLQAIRRAKKQLRANLGCISQLSMDVVDISANDNIVQGVPVLVFEMQMPYAIERKSTSMQRIEPGATYPRGTLMVRPAIDASLNIARLMIALEDFGIEDSDVACDGFVLVGCVIKGFETLSCTFDTIPKAEGCTPPPLAAFPLAHVQALGPVRYTEFLRRYGGANGQRLHFVSDIRDASNISQDQPWYFLGQPSEDVTPHFPSLLESNANFAELNPPPLSGMNNEASDHSDSESSSVEMSACMEEDVSDDAGSLSKSQWLVNVAQHLKYLGNGWYAKSQPFRALQKYDKALRYIDAIEDVEMKARVAPLNATLQLNRGAVLVKLASNHIERSCEDPCTAKCIHDARAALTFALDSNLLTPQQKIKGLYRRAKVAETIEESMQDLSDAQVLDGHGDFAATIQAAWIQLQADTMQASSV